MPSFSTPAGRLSHGEHVSMHITFTAFEPEPQPVTPSYSMVTKVATALIDAELGMRPTPNFHIHNVLYEGEEVIERWDTNKPASEQIESDDDNILEIVLDHDWRAHNNRIRRTNMLTYLLERSDEWGRVETDNLAADVKNDLGFSQPDWKHTKDQLAYAGPVRFEVERGLTRRAIIDLERIKKLLERRDDLFAEECCEQLLDIIASKKAAQSKPTS